MQPTLLQPSRPRQRSLFPRAVEPPVSTPTGERRVPQLPEFRAVPEVPLFSPVAFLARPESKFAWTAYGCALRSSIRLLCLFGPLCVVQRGCCRSLFSGKARAGRTRSPAVQEARTYSAVQARRRRKLKTCATSRRLVMLNGPNDFDSAPPGHFPLVGIADRT